MSRFDEAYWKNHPAFEGYYQHAFLMEIFDRVTDPMQELFYQLEQATGFIDVPLQYFNENQRRQTLVYCARLRRSEMSLQDIDDYRHWTARVMNTANQPYLTAMSQKPYVNYGGGGGGGGSLSAGSSGSGFASVTIPNSNHLTVNPSPQYSSMSAPSLSVAEIQSIFRTELAKMKEEIVQQVCDELQRIERTFLERDL